MHHTAAELQQGLGLIAVLLVLPDALQARRLPRPGVFQLQGGDGQAVDEQHHVDRFVRVAQGVAHLAGNAELIGGESLVHFPAAGGQRQGVEQRKVGVVQLQSAAQHAQNAVLFDQPVQQLQDAQFPLRLPLQLFQLFGLGSFQKVPEAPLVDSVFGIVILCIAQPVFSSTAVG